MPKKGDTTKSRILDAALALFTEHGYEATTMRMIAEHTDMSLGNFYYHFPSKEHLVFQFYEKNTREYLTACSPILAREKTLKNRLHGVLRARIDTAQPYHHLSQALFAAAADPRSSLSPFSDESKAIRDEVTTMFADVISGSSAHIPRDLAPELPNLLWIYLMGVTLFWVYDFSPGFQRSYQLVDATVPVIVRVIALANLPVLRSTQRNIVRIIKDVTAPSADR